MLELDAQDAALLNTAQNDFPFSPEPWTALGKQLGMDEAEVLRRLQRLKEGRILRQVSAIFDSRTLGYQSALIAARAPMDHLERAAAVISAHPGVSHNYQREHSLNLWFTLATPPGVAIDVAAARLALDAGLSEHHVLPSQRTFRIGVTFDLAKKGARTLDTAPLPKKRAAVAILSDEDKEAIRALQEPLPLEPQPFLSIARSLGLDEYRLFAWMRGAREQGFLRRFAAVLRHREAGFGEGGMGVWQVPAERTEEVGLAMARESAVTHCYQRASFEGWPFNLFTMVHGQNRDECRAILQRLADRVQGWQSREVLFSCKEFKKERVRYFIEEPVHA